MKIVFPQKHIKPLYYDIHIRYMIEYCKAAGCEVEFAGETSLDNTTFMIYVDGKPVVVDFSDFDILRIVELQHPCLKFHCSEKTLRTHPTVLPFPPVSFYNWQQYDMLNKVITYKCNSDIILCRQRPYAGALERRTKVQQMLKGIYGEKVKTDVIGQLNYWQEINNCLVAVFVPGARNDMLDRGHAQYMAFGCCTISPKVNDVLPKHQKLEPGVHYILCQDDYSDLAEQIEFVRHTRPLAAVIGSNAKDLFRSVCLPKPLEIAWKPV
jgi:hypothetical protein